MRTFRLIPWWHRHRRQSPCTSAVEDGMQRSATEAPHCAESCGGKGGEGGSAGYSPSRVRATSKNGSLESRRSPSPPRGSYISGGREGAAGSQRCGPYAYYYCQESWDTSDPSLLMIPPRLDAKFAIAGGPPPARGCRGGVVAREQPGASPAAHHHSFQSLRTVHGCGGGNDYRGYEE